MRPIFYSKFDYGGGFEPMIFDIDNFYWTNHLVYDLIMIMSNIHLYQYIAEFEVDSDFNKFPIEL